MVLGLVFFFVMSQRIRREGIGRKGEVRHCRKEATELREEGQSSEGNNLTPPSQYEDMKLYTHERCVV